MMVVPAVRRSGESNSESAHRVLSGAAARARWAHPLPAAFYARDPAVVAEALIGCLLLMRDGRTMCGGEIVEVEAYLGAHDAASHAVAGRTARTHHLFGAPGTVYVYRSYGVHWCVNAVTNHEGSGSAVLIRALRPLAGLTGLASRSRGGARPWEWCRGPGRLCRAMAIDKSHDGTMFTSGPLRIAAATSTSIGPIHRTRRIGITKAVDLPLRFLLAGAQAVSGPRRLTTPQPPGDGGENPVSGDESGLRSAP
jgi:DNA-3-methyladenine glycosylase